MRFMAPIERFIYKLAGINPNEEMDWKAFLKSAYYKLFSFWFFWGMICWYRKRYLPLNPDGNSGQSQIWRSTRVLVSWLTVTCTIAEKAV